MKKEVMKRAWEMMKKGFAETFSECLKASWELEKDLNKFLSTRKETEEKLNKMMLESDFRKVVNRSNLSTNIKFVGEGVFNFENHKLWVKKGIARIYADKYIDGKSLGQCYIETKIN